MLDATDLLQLIRLTHIELHQMQIDLDSDDDETRNNAGELIVQTENLANKLKLLYNQAISDDDDPISYDDFIQQIECFRPFT
jgi:hypothetical protein